MDEQLTPYDIERRLLVLSRELDSATTDLADAEAAYHKSKSEYELLIAKTRIKLAEEYKGQKLTVQEKEDMALVRCEREHLALAADTAWVRGSRGNIERIKTQIDVARSMGTSVRAAMEVS